MTRITKLRVKLFGLNPVNVALARTAEKVSEISREGD